VCRMSADRLRWKEKGADAASKSLSSLDELRQRNLELLDLVIGTWTDQHDSVYSVQLDGGVEQNSCSVYTTRASGHTLKTKGLIRVQKGQAFVLRPKELRLRRIAKKLRHDERSGRNRLAMRSDGFVKLQDLATSVHLNEQEVLSIVEAPDSRGRMECFRHESGTWIRSLGDRHTRKDVNKRLIQTPAQECFRQNPPEEGVAGLPPVWAMPPPPSNDEGAVGRRHPSGYPGHASLPSKAQLCMAPRPLRHLVRRSPRARGY
ncbi:unnamed protein product, partial [Effrenium voratum]